VLIEIGIAIAIGIAIEIGAIGEDLDDAPVFDPDPDPDFDLERTL